MPSAKTPKSRKFKPTDVDREQVAKLAGLGLALDKIGSVIQDGVSISTLRRYFPDELLRGSARATEKVAQSLFDRASGGKDTIASIFWLKAKDKWHEVQKHELGGPDGAPLQVSHIELVVVDPKGKSK